MNKKNAFTLAEVLIVMALIGALAIILLPNTKTLIPNKSLTMFKKAYSVTGQTVNALLDDEDLYPEKDYTENGESVFVSNLMNTDAAIYRTDSREGDTKFCYLFAEMLNVTSEIKCEDTSIEKFTDNALPVGHFTTTDGMVWILPISNFDSADTNYEIYVDINGEDGPNKFVAEKCTANTNSDGSSKCNGIDPDRFTILINQDGKLTAGSDIEKFYLKSENSSDKYYAGDKD